VGNVRTRIVGTRKGDDLYLLPAEGDPLPPAGTSVHGGLDDERRTSLMRTHSGLHVLSAIVLRDFGAPVTGGNMEPLIARMDFDLSDVPSDFKQRVEDACNEAVRLDRRIDVRVLPRERALAIPNIIRTASDLLPPDIEMVRIVDIDGIDMQADGGTHVASTAMIGRIAVTKMESKGRGFRRLRIRIEDAELSSDVTIRSAGGAGRCPSPSHELDERCRAWRGSPRSLQTAGQRSAPHPGVPAERPSRS
jgi:misacylated tRNA(Ala) deacylase